VERNNSQVHKLRSKFESERKAHRNNIYNSIIRKERSVHATMTSVKNHDSTLKPRWNKSLMGNMDVKKKLFKNNNHYSNYSVSIPSDQEKDFLDEK